MALSKEQIDFLKNLDNNCVHGKNILAKRNKENIERFFPKYRDFLGEMNKNINLKIKAFTDYKSFVHNNNKKENGKLIFSQQSKFEPSILEEFLYHLFK